MICTVLEYVSVHLQECPKSEHCQLPKVLFVMEIISVQLVGRQFTA